MFLTFLRKQVFQKAILCLVCISFSVVFTGCGGSSSPVVVVPVGNDDEQSNEVNVTLAKGDLVGEKQDNGTVRFLGIPYAQPPVGDLRFRPPQDVEAWSGVMSAATLPPLCQQQVNGDFLTTAEAENGMSEDCLYLNVIAPENADSLPVIVWIHGGGLVAGAGSLKPDDGEELVSAEDVIFVSINYRLGALGYLVADELINESEYGVAGNYGALDQVAALNWVQENISAFGGDPTRVTIFGESAGGGSICALLGSPIAQGLFSRAVISSGVCYNNSVESEVQKGLEVIEHVGCANAEDTLVCLRSLPEDAFNDVSMQLSTEVRGLEVHIDDVSFFAPIKAIKENTYGDIPLVVGANSYEMGAIFVDNQIPDHDAYLAKLGEDFGLLAGPLYELYPPDTFSDLNVAYKQLLSDIIFNCIAEELVEAASDGEPAYLYDLDISPVDENGAYHGLLAAYFYDYYESVFFTPPSETHKNVTRRLNHFWAAFTEDGVMPTEWPSYNMEEKQYYRFSVEDSVETNYRANRCTALRQLGFF